MSYFVKTNLKLKFLLIYGKYISNAFVFNTNNKYIIFCNNKLILIFLIKNDFFEIVVIKIFNIQLKIKKTIEKMYLY